MTKTYRDIAFELTKYMYLPLDGSFACTEVSKIIVPSRSNHEVSLLGCLFAFFFFPFLCVYRKGSVIAHLELTFNEKVGASEVQALLSEVTKHGKLGDLEVSQVVTDPSIEGQLFVITNICEPLI